MLKQIRGHWYNVIPPRGEDSRHLPLAENLTGRLDIHVGVFVLLPQCLAIIMQLYNCWRWCIFKISLIWYLDDQILTRNDGVILRKRKFTQQIFKQWQPFWCCSIHHGNKHQYRDINKVVNQQYSWLVDKGLCNNLYNITLILISCLFYLDLYKNEFKNFIWTSKFKFSFGELLFSQTCLTSKHWNRVT
jgi:hypothetical protein